MGRRRVAASAVAPLVAFSAATNRSLAGSGARIDGAVPDEPRLRVLLAGFGVRVIEDGRADLVLAADVDAVRPAGPAVVVGCGPQAARPEARVVRLGVEATERSGVLIVRGLPPASGPGDAGARIDWARANMPVSTALAAALGELAHGVRIGISMVLEPKTAVLALLLQEAGAEVGVFAFAAETDDDVARELRARGIPVRASADATPAEERTGALALLDARPQVLVDDGAHVIRLAHRVRPDVVAGLLGATEETTSGVTPLRAMAAEGALLVPVIAANDAAAKTWIDNRHGTGETCVLAIVRALDDDLEGAAIAVVGFGPVGEGCAQRFAALGAAVTVVERDPRRALAARYAGYAVAPIREAAAAADLVVSATGVRGTIDAAVLEACRDGAVIAVAGGAPEEVLLPLGTRVDGEDVRLPGGRRVRLLAGGDCVNIVAGEGNPIEVMDLSFAVQLAAIRRLLEGPALPPGVHALPEAEDVAVAATALTAVVPVAPAAAPPPDWRRTRFDLA